MTRDDVIRLAKEARLLDADCLTGEWAAPLPQQDYPERLMRFADLVAAHEREECAKVCGKLIDDWKEANWQGASEEYLSGKEMAGMQCVTAIRARRA